MRAAAFLSLLFFYTATQAGPRPTEVIENLDQFRIVLYLTEPQIQSMPAWQPGAGKPPMSLATAVERVMRWKAGEPALAEASIYELKYKPIHNHEKLHRWYYLVELRLPQGHRRFVAVLADGKVVPAIVEPGS